MGSYRLHGGSLWSIYLLFQYAQKDIFSCLLFGEPGGINIPAGSIAGFVNCPIRVTYAAT
jgi:hypothetical protein